MATTVLNGKLPVGKLSPGSLPLADVIGIERLAGPDRPKSHMQQLAPDRADVRARMPPVFSHTPAPSQSSELGNKACAPRRLGSLLRRLVPAVHGASPLL